MSILCMCMAIAASRAEEYNIYDEYRSIPKRTYINLSYQWQKIDMGHNNVLPAHSRLSNEGGSFEIGHTFFFNARNPIVTPGLGEIRIGLDWSFLDVSAASWKVRDSRDRIYFANVGMQIGPSVTFTPVRRVNIKGYLHYAPSFAACAIEKWDPRGEFSDSFDNFMGGYAGYVTGGVHASYRFITLGVELRGGHSDFRSIGDDDDDDMSNPLRGRHRGRAKLSGTRFVFGFRF